MEKLLLSIRDHYHILLTGGSIGSFCASYVTKSNVAFIIGVIAGLLSWWASASSVKKNKAVTRKVELELEELKKVFKSKSNRS